MKTNPNAKVAGGVGLSGILLVAVLGYFNVDLTAEAGATIAAGMTTSALFIGRNGIVGVFRMIWRGGANGAEPKP